MIFIGLIMNKNDYDVRKISRKQAEPFILEIHYAARWPSISYLYGLFLKDVIVGVVSYGTPPSSPLRKGICGAGNEGLILELNRLILLNNLKNEASFLVSKSIKMLPRGMVVISFADSSQNHVGYVYQSSNFTYHGLSAKRTDWKVKGLEHLHGITIADQFRGQSNRSKLMREKYGDDFYLQERPRKHRYIYVTGSRSDVKRIRGLIKYKQEPYPKLPA